MLAVASGGARAPPSAFLGRGTRQLCDALRSGRFPPGAALGGGCQIVAPTYVPDLVHACPPCGRRRAGALSHANPGALTGPKWQSRRVRRRSRRSLVEGRPTARSDLPRRARRIVLSSERGTLHRLLECLSRYSESAATISIVRILLLVNETTRERLAKRLSDGSQN